MPLPGISRSFAWPSLGLFVALAILHTWPLAQAPGTWSRNDTADTVLHEWTLAWLAHQVVRAPLHLFDANIFYPDRLTLAYSDHLFVPGIFAAPLIWLGASPVLVYNLLLLTGFVLTGWVMSLVVCRWTSSRTAGLLSGSLLAFNAFTLTRLPQIQDQHVEFLPLALLALDQLIRAPGLRPALALAGWFVLQALTSGYWLLFTIVAMAGGALARAGEWAGGLRRRSFLAHASLAGALATVVMLPFLAPYWIVSREQGLSRSLDEVALFSAGVHNYLATGGRLHYETWSHQFYGGDSLFPGVVALCLGAASLVTGVALRDGRARMALVFGILAFALSFGPAMPGYAQLYEVFPLLTGIRGASRFGQLVLAAVAILAGFGWARLQAGLTASARPIIRRAGPALAATLLIAVHAEALRTPIAYSEYQELPPVWDELRRTGDDAVLAFLPFPPVESVFTNTRYMLGSTRALKPMINGYSGFTPPSYQRHAAALGPFPDRASIDYLREVGVTHVVVEGHLMHESRLAALERFPELQLAFTDGSFRIYALDP